MGIQHNLIVFDYNNTETFIKLEKINEIINSNIVIDESIEKENLNDFFDDNYDKTKENEIKCIKFNSNFEKEEIENNNNLFEFINIIIADYLRYPNYTHFFNIENIYNFLIYNFGDKIKQNNIINNNKEIIKPEYNIPNNIKYNFNEEILLKLVIERMKEIEEKIKKKVTLPELGIKKNLEGQPDYIDEKPLSLIFNAQNLYEKGLSLAKKIIKNCSDKTIPFSDISVNILLDCSGFINIQNKLKQFVIICGIANSLTVLNIPYAISLVGDSQFECTLKPFKARHSIEYFQKILDCLFIKRFQSKNANSIQYALKFTKCTSYNRTILVFTDGLDEDFLLIESWKKLLKNPKNSFGFFFIYSNYIYYNHHQKMDYLISKWNEFKKEIKEEGINIEMISYSNGFEEFNKIYNEISFLISNLLTRTMDENKKVNENNSQFILPIFELKQIENIKSIAIFEKA